MMKFICHFLIFTTDERFDEIYVVCRKDRKERRCHGRYDYVILQSFILILTHAKVFYLHPRIRWPVLAQFADPFKRARFFNIASH